MTCYFSIVADVERRVVHVELGGFFGRDDIERFATRRRAAHRDLGDAGDHVTIVDMRDMKIQSVDSVEAFRLMLCDPRYRSRRIAFVVRPGLARQQIRRVAATRGAGFFTDPDDAMHWLAAAETDAVPPAPVASPWLGDRATDQASTPVAGARAG